MIVAQVTPNPVDGAVPAPNLGRTHVDREANVWTVSRADFVPEVGRWFTLYPAGRVERPDIAVRAWRVDSDIFLLLGDGVVLGRLLTELPRAWTRADLAASADAVARRARERWPDVRVREFVDGVATGRRLGHRITPPPGPAGYRADRRFGAISDDGVPVDPDDVPR